MAMVLGVIIGERSFVLYSLPLIVDANDIWLTGKFAYNVNVVLTGTTLNGVSIRESNVLDTSLFLFADDFGTVLVTY